MIQIKQAAESDIPVIEDILADTVVWLNSIDKPLWTENQIKWARLSRDFDISDFYIACFDGKPAACMAVIDYDPEFWADIPKGESLFIHKVAVKRFAAGQGLSDALIEHAKEMCVDRGICELRLDCHSLIPKLRAVYERNGFVCVDEKVLYGKYHTAFYLCEVYDTNHLYHYYEKGTPPFRTLTSLPFEEAKAVMISGLADKTMFNDLQPTWIDNFLRLRYDSDKTLRERFSSIGGKPARTSPVYFTLGANKGMKTWFEEPAWIKIPMSEFDADTVSFTYGDSFAVFNEALNTGEDWWGQIYKYDGIMRVIEKYGFPEDPPYNMRNKIFPEGRHINHCLKFVEAHVWSDEVLNKYRTME